MHASFSFCGTDIEDLGLNYAPEIENTYVLKPAATTAHYETFEGHNGGYLYGAWSEPKVFILRCYFEEKSIESGIMQKIYSLFKVGRSGKLIFSRSPWCYYYATVTEPIEENFTNYLNGYIIIHMKAMYPYARSDIYQNSYTEKYHDQMMRNTAVFESEEMLLPDIYTNITETKTIILANQGTVNAALGIAIAGDTGTGVIISNTTTGQTCKVIAVSKAKTTDVNREIVIDPISGKTMLVGNGYQKMSFVNHEYGFLELEHSFPAIRDIYIHSAGSNQINVSSILKGDLFGKYIFASGSWRKIIEIPDEHTLRVDSKVPAKNMEKTMIVSMNEIVISPVSSMDIDSLRFIYKPTYA